jgi:nicotinate phosphoribosyltransferase
MTDRTSLAMLTDLYELTMAAGYWKLGMADREAVFCLFYRTQPFKGTFALGAGLEQVAHLVEDFRFTATDTEYLRTLKTSAGTPLFEEAFLDYLRELKLEVDVDMVPEGTCVFPHEPLVRVTGPLLHAQILETVILNIVNFQTLIATKAARLRVAAPGDEIIEFGLRRAQGVDGGLSASRAAYVGGCDSTSNTLAGKRYNIPVRGTHAHSWIMAFDTELESFESYAEVMGDNCVLLVDTYDTPEGVRHAAQVGKKLKERGKKLLGVRLDSGDLLSLSIEARKILDEAGLHDARIMASNELDEGRVRRLKEAGAPITIWGVGTRLATGHPEAAVDGVYKLTAIRQLDGTWAYKAKRSSQPEKVSPPGILQIRRYADGDVVVDVGSSLNGIEAIGKDGQMRRFDGPFEELLVPVVRKGQVVYDLPPLADVRKRAIAGVRALEGIEDYFVGTERSLHELKEALLGAGR